MNFTRNHWCRLLAALALGWLALAVVPAHAEETADKPGAPAAGKFEIPIPIGQTSTGVVVQDLDEAGREQGLMKAREATRINEDEVELGDLRLKLMGSAEKPQEMNITIEKAVFNLKTSVLRSRSRVHIQRQDFDLYGDAMEYNTITGEAQLFGDVTMIIHDADKLAQPAESAPNAAQTEGAAPRSTAATP